MKSSSNQSNHPESKTRKPYQKPVVERVSLVLDDAILITGCKNAARVGPLQDACRVGLTLCSEIGS